MKYVALYTIKAYERGLGDNFTPYEKEESWKFKAVDGDEAKKLAWNHRTAIARELIMALVTLESLLKVEEVILGKDAKSG